MKYLPLVLAGLLRKKPRTLLTLLSVAAAFALFGMLDAVRVAFTAPETATGIDRLIVSSRLSLTQTLPSSYLARIASVPGVAGVAHADWFGGIYQDPKNFFPNIAVSDNYLTLHPEYELPPAQQQAFLKTRTGAIVGAALAERFGWRLGDKIPLQGALYPNKDGTDRWLLDLVGIYRVGDAQLRGLERQLLFRYAYFDEGRTLGEGTVGWFTVRVADPRQADRVAQAIDRQFANSAFETTARSERDFQRSFAQQIGDIGLIVTAIMAAVFFTLLLLTGNTMAQAIRERIPELAVLKTIGFSNRAVLLLVMAESVTLLVLGGLAGLVMARLALPVISEATSGQLDVVMATRSWLLGGVLMVAIGLIVGLPPALKAMRLRIVDALAGR
ncbi:FtsX-like permease family protein [Thiococcus pfennigii]|uniref:FtsX-like permease family protein n=1 Tax=Thiococcus pfennigii TaxID=1057 RepID=UPI0019040949|nr:hypothetical protein [Thiococcus pfennigii]MBK1730494.1 hypothetical protein [Thiococcus pfennigii]